MQKILSLLLLLCALSAFGQNQLQLQVEDTKQLPLIGAVVHFMGKHNRYIARCLALCWACRRGKRCGSLFEGFAPEGPHNA